jgi:hypothetical protein
VTAAVTDAVGAFVTDHPLHGVALARVSDQLECYGIVDTITKASASYQHNEQQIKTTLA